MIVTYIRRHKRFLVTGLLVLVALYLVLFIASIYGSKNILMWVYTRDPSGKVDVAQVTSGYASIRDCERAGRIYNYSVNIHQSFFHCATGCPIDAQSEQECKQHD